MGDDEVRSAAERLLEHGACGRSCVYVIREQAADTLTVARAYIAAAERERALRQAMHAAADRLFNILEITVHTFPPQAPGWKDSIGDVMADLRRATRSPAAQDAEAACGCPSQIQTTTVVRHSKECSTRRAAERLASYQAP